MNADFACTQCGRCCHDLKLPLTVAEAMAWLEAGHEVQVLCEATPWPAEPPPGDARAAHRRKRSFAAESGALPVRVVVILAAAFSGPCPNLGPGMACGIYERRPLVCRVYPAEISPFIELQPGAKACPPEAWAPGLPALLRGGVLVDADLRAAVQASRDADAVDAPFKQRACEALGIHLAAVADEGFVVHSPDPQDLLAALLAAAQSPARPPASGSRAAPWHIVSGNPATAAAWQADGADTRAPTEAAAAGAVWLALAA